MLRTIKETRPFSPLEMIQCSPATFTVQHVLVSFEADERGYPDPLSEPGYSFADIKADLEKQAGEHTTVQVGINCTGLSNVRRLMHAHETLDVV